MIAAPPPSDPHPRFFELSEFRLESGEMLPMAKIAYATFGTLNADKTNAVLVPSWYGSDHHGYDFLLGPGEALDPARYFVVATEMFANGFSSSPSNTPSPLDGPRFPAIAIRDNVEAARRLLESNFAITHLHAIVGFSMGAQQAFQWAVSHPDRVARIVPYCGAAKTYPHGQVRLESAMPCETDLYFPIGDATYEAVSPARDIPSRHSGDTPQAAVATPRTTSSSAPPSATSASNVGSETSVSERALRVGYHQHALTSISRRTLLGAGIAAAVAPAATAWAGTAPRSDVQAAPAIAADVPDVVVVGAGVFGAWTALTLRERGAKVTLLDAHGPGHPRATSCDEVRQIRMSYGDREVYTRSAMNALQLWTTRQEEFGRRLVFPGGRLVMRHAWNKELEDQKMIFDRLSLPYEVLKPEEMTTRYPQVNFEGVGVGFLDINAGLLKAREAIVAITETFERKGGTIRLARAMPGATARRTLQNATLAGGGILSAGAFVFACGPWLRHVFPDLLGKVITTARIEIAYIGSPAGDSSYRQGVLPNLSEADTFPGAPGEVSYTQSDIDAGLKIARGGERLPMDLDHDERIVSARQISRIHEYVRVRFPKLKEPIVASRVCQSDASPDNHFVLDRHPGFDNVWIAGGGSGHGFKHGPVVGEYMADRVMGRPAPPELQGFFSLAKRG